MTDLKLIISIYLRGTELDPENVSRLVGLPPSRAQRAGEAHTSSTGKRIVFKIGLWGITASTNSQLISDHILELAPAAEAIQRALPDLQGLEEAYVDIFAAAKVDAIDVPVEFELDPADMRVLAQLGLPIRFTVATGVDD